MDRVLFCLNTAYITTIMSDYSWHIPDPLTQPEFYDDIPTKRAIAWVVDSLIVLVLCLLILPFTAFTGLFFFPLLWLCVGFVYRSATIARGSATWGMALTAIEFRARDGARLDSSIALLHTAGYSFSILFFPLQFASILAILTTQRRQSLVDMTLGTVAINRRAGT